MEDLKQQIEDNGYNYQDFVLRVLQALRKHLNQDFQSVITPIWNRFERGDATVTYEEIRSTAVSKFNNLKGTRLPDGGNAWTAPDPSTQKIMALTTQLAELRAAGGQGQESGGGGDAKMQGGKPSNGGGGSGPPNWQVTRDGDTKTVGGQTYVCRVDMARRRWTKAHPSTHCALL